MLRCAARRVCTCTGAHLDALVCYAVRRGVCAHAQVRIWMHLYATLCSEACVHMHRCAFGCTCMLRCAARRGVRAHAQVCCEVAMLVAPQAHALFVMGSLQLLLLHQQFKSARLNAHQYC